MRRAAPGGGARCAGGDADAARQDRDRRRRGRPAGGVQPPHPGRRLVHHPRAGHPGAAVGVPARPVRRAHVGHHRGDLGRGERATAVHRQLPAGPGRVLVRQRADRRRGFQLPVAADAQPARGRRRGRLPAHHRRPLPGGGQDRRGGLRPVLPGLAHAVRRPAAGAPAQGRPGRVERRAGRQHPGFRWPVRGRCGRPGARPDHAGPQRPLLGDPGGRRPARAAVRRRRRPRRPAAQRGHPRGDAARRRRHPVPAADARRRGEGADRSAAHGRGVGAAVGLRPVGRPPPAPGGGSLAGP